MLIKHTQLAQQLTNYSSHLEVLNRISKAILRNAHHNITSCLNSLPIQIKTTPYKYTPKVQRRSSITFHCVSPESATSIDLVTWSSWVYTRARLIEHSDEHLPNLMSSVDDPASANGPPAKVWLCFISVSKFLWWCIFGRGLFGSSVKVDETRDETPCTQAFSHSTGP